MYSELASHSQRQKAMVGVSAAGEFALTDDMTSPLTESNLRWALDKIGKHDEQRRNALRLFKSIYDDKKARGQHQGPELLGLRVYEKRWRIRPDLANIDKPESRKLVAHMEFEPPASKASSPGAAP